MITGKSINRALSLSLAIVFLSTNIAYSSESTLRVPIALDTQQRISSVYSIVSQPSNLGRIAPAPKKRDESRRFRYVVLGAGIQGASVAYDLASQSDTRGITIVDIDKDRAGKLADILPISKDKISVLQADLSKPDSLRELFQKSDVVIGAAHYALNAELARVASETGAHFIDMGGNTEVVLKEFNFADTAIRNGASIIPDMGLAPGMADLLALDGINEMDVVNDVKIRVGGLPSNDSKAFDNPLRYMLVFSIFGLINEYMGEALAIRDGKVVSIPTFGERESFEIDGNQYEAFPTSGGTSTLTFTLTSGEFRGKVKNLDYMTIRYPGHADIIQAFIEMGFFDETKITIKGNEFSPYGFFSTLANIKGKTELFNKNNIQDAMQYLGFLSVKPMKVSEGGISPRQLFAQLASKALDFPGEKDKVVIYVSVSGEKDGQSKTIEYYYDSSMAGAYGSQFSEMARTTGFPVSITALMLARGQIKYVGAAGPEHFVPTDLLIKELRNKGVGIDKRIIEGVSAKKLASNQGVGFPSWWMETGGLIMAIEKLAKLTSKSGRNVVLTFKAPDFFPYADYYKDQKGAEMVRERRSIVDLSDEGIDAAIELGKAIVYNKGSDWGVEFPTNATMEQIEAILIDAAGLQTANALSKITAYFERLSKGWKERTHVVFTFDDNFDGFRFQGILGVPLHEEVSKNEKISIEYTIRYIVGNNVDVYSLLNDIGMQLVKRDVFESMAWRIHVSNIITSIELAELSGKATGAKALNTGL